MDLFMEILECKQSNGIPNTKYNQNIIQDQMSKQSSSSV